MKNGTLHATKCNVMALKLPTESLESLKGQLWQTLLQTQQKNMFVFQGQHQFTTAT